ncbi:DUF4153 domain-containing protein [Caulobacter segnis]
MTDATDGRTSRATALTRLAIGLAQGIALFLLQKADESKAWPATQPMLYAPLLVCALMVPLIPLAALSAMRRTFLIGWSLVAATLAAILAVHAAWTGAAPDRVGAGPLSPPLFIAVAAAVHRPPPGPAGRSRPQARGALCRLFRPGRDQRRAAGPVAAVHRRLLAAAVPGRRPVQADRGRRHPEADRRDRLRLPGHRPDVRRRGPHGRAADRGPRRPGARACGPWASVLLAWLLPLMVVIAAGFLATLPFTGLAPLWGTKAAASLLPSAAAALIILVNAAYQDGLEPPNPILRWAARAAGLLLIPIVVLAAYALWLRVHQYGLTPDRVLAATYVIVAVGFTGGYTLAALRPAPWMKPLERTNLVMAAVSRAAADRPVHPGSPTRRGCRWAARSSGWRPAGSRPRSSITFLRFQSGRYGNIALERLKSARDPQVAASAAASARRTSPYEAPQGRSGQRVRTPSCWPRPRSCRKAPPCPPASSPSTNGPDAIESPMHAVQRLPRPSPGCRWRRRVPRSCWPTRRWWPSTARPRPEPGRSMAISICRRDAGWISARPSRRQ